MRGMGGRGRAGGRFLAVGADEGELGGLEDVGEGAVVEEGEEAEGVLEEEGG